MNTIKGQNFRIFLDGKVVAAAKNGQLHVAANLEDAGTKDDTGGAPNQEMTGYTYDFQSDSLFTVATDSDGNNSIDVLKMLLKGKAVPFSFEQTGGDQNRVKMTGSKNVITGNLLINDNSIGAENKTNSTFSFQAQGNGPLLIDGVDYAKAETSAPATTE